MKIKFTKQAVQDIEDVYQYVLRQADEDIALNTIHKIKNVIDNLNIYTQLGFRCGKNSRKLVIPKLPFVVIYQLDVKKDIIYIGAIFHTSRKINTIL